MRIPSYDDLTPSIPDVSPADVFASAAAFLPESGPVVSSDVAAAPVIRELYAALHGKPRDPAIPRRPDPGALLCIARDFSPRVECHSGGTIVLDVAGLQRLLGTPSGIAADLARAGAASVAVAPSQVAALLLARACPGVTVATDGPEAALRDVRIDVLEQWMADCHAAGPAPATWPAPASCARSFDVLRRWGLTTLGEFAALPAAALSARLGTGGMGLQRLARGIDPRPLVPDPGVKRFIEACELEWPIDALQPLSFVFARVLDPLSAALERADRGAVALRLDLRLTDRSCHTRVLALPSPIRDSRVLRTLLLLDLESHPPAAAVDVVTIEIDPAPGRVVQHSLLDRAVPSPEALATLMARLGALMGEARCGAPVLPDTHRPDAFEMGPAPAGERPTRGNSTSRGVPPASEPVGVSAFENGGRQPGVVRSVLRRFRPPVAIRVAVEGGRPARVAVDRRGMPGGRVVQAAGPWRTSGGWWQPVRWNRDEWDVALADGAVCRVFHDRDAARWFMDGIFD